jgi:transmembrane secretion effector
MVLPVVDTLFTSKLASVRRAGNVTSKSVAATEGHDGGFMRDTERPDVSVDTFGVHSWAEHLRQAERVTHADRDLEERVRSYTAKEPKVKHLVYAMPTR